METITNLYLYIDYDDAFAALINSVEVVRGNISGFAPDFLSLVNTPKEAKSCIGEDLDRYDPMYYLYTGDNLKM